jgi:1,4-dihydroxy-6-naphthoate synthase
MLTLAYSPCPNDTFLFHAWSTGLIPNSPAVKTYLEDIQTLNERACQGIYDVTKVSTAWVPHLLQEYIVLPSGSALGHNCGPKLVAKKLFSLNEIAQKTIAVPGRMTTANRLLATLCDPPKHIVYTSYEKVIPLILSGEVDAGLIIHETRFTYQNYGMVEIADLGTVWEQKYRMAIPLGSIVAKRSLGAELLNKMTTAIQTSYQMAQKRTPEAQQYILTHSREKDLAVIRQHIELYVNQESYSLSKAGRESVERLCGLKGQEWIWNLRS